MNIALIFAGGTGQRMNTKGRPKQFLKLNGKPIIIHTVEHFENHSMIDYIVIVCLKGWEEYLSDQLSKYGIKKVHGIVLGGDTGQDSIKKGLIYIKENIIKFDKENNDIVLIHDGVRPLIDKNIITDNINSVLKYGNAITVTEATETIIKINDDECVDTVEDRSRCRLARAPQSFFVKDILKAHLKAESENLTTMVDSAMLMKYYGADLHVVLGPNENIKITTPSDFYICKAIIDAKENSQIWGL